MMRLQKLLLGLLLLSSMVGCADKERALRQRYFWPPFADSAKIEYLGFYASEANLRGALFSNLAEVVLGVEVARNIFSRPFAVDARKQKFLVTDVGLRVVFVFDLQRKKIEQLSLEQKDSKAMGFPAGVAFLGDDEYLVVDSLAHRVNRYSAGNNRMTGSFGAEKLLRPTGIAVDYEQGQIVVADTEAHRLALFSLAGEFQGYIGSRGAGPGTFNYPVDVDFDKEGNLFVLDSLNFRVQRFDRVDDGYRYALSFGETGTALGSFSRPKSLAITPSGHVYVTDALANKVLVFDREGRFLLPLGGKFVASRGRFAPGGLYMPSGIAADERDGIWVVDSLNRMVHHFQYLNEEYLKENPILPGEGAFVGGQKQ